MTTPIFHFKNHQLCSETMRNNYLVSSLLVFFLNVVNVGAVEEPSETQGESAELDEADRENPGKGERVGALDAEQLEQMTLSQEVKAKDLVWLEVNYPGVQDAVKVLALEQKPRLAEAQGAVLILHDTEQHADWPQIIRPLRMSLPDAGWHTLSVNLPYERLRDMPERTITAKKNDQIMANPALSLALQAGSPRAEPAESVVNNTVQSPDEPNTDKENSQAPGGSDLESAESGSEDSEQVDIDLADRQKAQKIQLPYRDRAILHIEAAMDYLRNKGYQNIVIAAYRAGADFALAHIKPKIPQIPQQGFALVMIDPLLPDSYQADMSEIFDQNFRAPVLDIANSADLVSQELAEERGIGARIANMQNYHQLSMVVAESSAGQKSLVRRIRFWLAKYAPGMAARKASSRQRQREGN